jgi:hypothetical protein
MARRGLSLLLLRLLGISGPPGAAAWDPLNNFGGGGPLELTTDTFEELISKSGQHAFVKFYDPKDRKSKQLRPKWHKVGAAFNYTEGVLIGDVNCKSEAGEKICFDLGVRQFPTLRYFADFTGMVGEDYIGKREPQDMIAFIGEYLVKHCDTKTKANCDDEEKAWLDKQAGKEAEKLQAELDRLIKLEGDAKTKDKSENKKWLTKRIKMLENMVGPGRTFAQKASWAYFRVTSRFWRLVAGVENAWLYFLELFYYNSGPIGPKIEEFLKFVSGAGTIGPDHLPHQYTTGLGSGTEL